VRLIAFYQTAFDDYNNWAQTDKKVFERLRRMIADKRQESI